MPRRIWIRLAIYVPLIGFFGWRAWQTSVARRAAQEAPAQRLETITLPDGTVRKVQYLSPDEAKIRFQGGADGAAAPAPGAAATTPAGSAGAPSATPSPSPASAPSVAAPQR